MISKSMAYRIWRFISKISGYRRRRLTWLRFLRQERIADRFFASVARAQAERVTQQERDEFIESRRSSMFRREIEIWCGAGALTRSFRDN